MTQQTPSAPKPRVGALNLENAKRCEECGEIIAPNLTKCYPCKYGYAPTQVRT